MKQDHGTRLTSQAGTKRNTYMTNSVFDIEMDMIADV